MNRLQYGKKLLQNCWSGVVVGVRRRKEKCVGIFRRSRESWYRVRDTVLFYSLPVKREIAYRPPLNIVEIEKVRRITQQLVLRQEKSLETSNYAEEVLARIVREKREQNSQKQSQIGNKGSSFLSAFRIPSYFADFTSSYLGSGNDTKPAKPQTLSTPCPIRKEKTISKADVDAKTIALVDSLSIEKSRDTTFLKRLENFCIHLHSYPWSQGLAIRCRAVGRILAIKDATTNDSVIVQCNETLGLLGYVHPPPRRGIRILSIDGGGMRGLIALEILKEIEQHTGKRIYENFDLICGVSTGAIIASFLSFHKKSIHEIEETYSTLGFKIFTQSILEGARGWLLNQSYYDSIAYEEILKTFVGDVRMTEALRNSDGPKAAIVSTLVSENHISPFVFRNYILPYRNKSNFKGSSTAPLWAAVRASSAAPGYFNDFLFEGKFHQDGGILTNNATQIAIHEAHRLWPGEPFQCVVSLGLGRFDGSQQTTSQKVANASLKADLKSSLKNNGEAKPLSLAQKFARIVDSATDTELVHETLHDLLPPMVYYRFNPYLPEYLSLDETRPEKFQLMRESTQMYLRRNEQKVIDACQQLMLARLPTDKFSDYIKYKYEQFSSSKMNSAYLYNNISIQ